MHPGLLLRARGNPLPEPRPSCAYGCRHLQDGREPLLHNGRNAVTWETKIAYDLQYIERITFLGDVKIILTTLAKVFKRDGITEENCDTATDLADYLLAKGRISQTEYDQGQELAQKLIAESK